MKNFLSTGGGGCAGRDSRGTTVDTLHPDRVDRKPNRKPSTLQGVVGAADATVEAGRIRPEAGLSAEPHFLFVNPHL